MNRLYVALLLFLLIISGGEAAVTPYTLSSPAFKDYGSIPSTYTCDSDNISPALSWEGAPEKTKSFALLVDDPDAPMKYGVVDHWVVFNLPPETKSLPENVQEFPKGTIVGQNIRKQNKYTGPCPPDREHRYFFKLYALDTILDLPEGSTKTEVEKAMAGHILGRAVLIGRFDRSKSKKKE